jgi:hypothetical protein
MPVGARFGDRRAFDESMHYKSIRCELQKLRMVTVTPEAGDCHTD